MRFNNNTFVCLGFVLTIAYGCTPKIDYTAEIRTLDSALVILETSANEFKSMDTVQMQALYDSISPSIKILESKIAGDTLPVSIANQINASFSLHNDLGNLIHNRDFLIRALSENRGRISDLKHDLLSSLIERDKAQSYVQNETRAASRISQTLVESSTKGKNASIQLDSMQVSIKNLADSLSSLPQ